jgi:hypothetical protein
MSALDDLLAAVPAGTLTDDLINAAKAEYADLSARPTADQLSQATAAAELAAAELAALRTDHTAALGELKTALLTGTHIPAEMVSGNSLAEIKQSIQSAQTIVDRIADGIKQSTKTPITNGAPPRTAPDLSTLPAIEKIARGLAATN